MQYPGRAVVNLAAIRHNVATLRARTDAAVMVVVKADGYGHGAVPVAQAALEAGATWIGVAQATEALAVARALREPHLDSSPAGLAPRVPPRAMPGGSPAPPGEFTLLTWIYGPSDDLTALVADGIHLSVSSPHDVEQVARAAIRAGTRAPVHLKIDTGMSRGGARPEEWTALVRAVLDHRELVPVAVWTHLARADEPAVPTTAEQLAAFHAADTAATALGLPARLRHVGASGGLMFHPDVHLDIVRVGIAAYGYPPDDSEPAAHGLIPAMRLEADLHNIKRVPAGTPVSYGHTAVVGPTRIALVPLGYSDGIPRQASNRAEVWLAGHRLPVVGRICMDQFVIDLGDVPAHQGDPVVLFGPPSPPRRTTRSGDAGPGPVPSAVDWARAADTIAYTIVTQIGPRVPRRYVDVPIQEGTWS